MNERIVKYDLEKALAIAAADGLMLAQKRGITDRTGLDALLAVKANRYRYFDGGLLMATDPEINAYYHNLGAAIDQIVQLANIDQQG